MRLTASVFTDFSVSRLFSESESSVSSVRYLCQHSTLFRPRPLWHVHAHQHLFSAQEATQHLYWTWTGSQPGPCDRAPSLFRSVVYTSTHCTRTSTHCTGTHCTSTHCTNTHCTGTLPVWNELWLVDLQQWSIMLLLCELQNWMMGNKTGQTHMNIKCPQTVQCLTHHQHPAVWHNLCSCCRVIGIIGVSSACHWSSVCAGDSLACCHIVSMLLPCLWCVVSVPLCCQHVVGVLLPCRCCVVAVLLPCLWRVVGVSSLCRRHIVAVLLLCRCCVAAVLLACWAVPLSLMRWGHVTGGCDVAAAAERAYLPFSLSVWIKEQSGTSSLPLIFNTSLIKEAELLKSRSSLCLCDSSSLITRLSLRFKRI